MSGRATPRACQGIGDRECECDCANISHIMTCPSMEQANREYVQLKLADALAEAVEAYWSRMGSDRFNEQWPAVVKAARAYRAKRGPW